MHFFLCATHVLQRGERVDDRVLQGRQGRVGGEHLEGRVVVGGHAHRLVQHAQQPLQLSRLRVEGRVRQQRRQRLHERGQEGLRRHVDVLVRRLSAADQRRRRALLTHAKPRGPRGRPQWHPLRWRHRDDVLSWGRLRRQGLRPFVHGALALVQHLLQAFQPGQ